MLLDLDAVDAFIEDRFTRSAFRLEVLDTYTVDSDRDNFERYLTGGTVPYWAEGDEWMDKLAHDRAAGKRNYRVHVVHSPLNEYLRYECEWGYIYTSRAGEDIYILDTAETPRPAGLIDEDFYLVDDEHVLVMRYDSEGHVLGGEPRPPSETPRYRHCRDVAMAHAVSFSTYWAGHPQYWRENWLGGDSSR